MLPIKPFKNMTCLYNTKGHRWKEGERELTFIRLIHCLVVSAHLMVVFLLLDGHLTISYVKMG